MKARNENGTIVLYPTLPIQYSSETLGCPLVDFNTLGDEVHQSEGFFDVVTPEYDYFTQKLGEIHFDEENKIFTYNVLQLDVPIDRPKDEVRWTQIQFMMMFTETERKNVRRLAKTDEDVEDIWDIFSKASYIGKDDPLTAYGLSILENKGCLDTGRTTEILS